MSDSPEPDRADLTGQTLDRYDLLGRIGSGGMGAVYEAEHTHLRKRVAVKLLRPDLAEDEVFRRRFLREARTASAVDHPHVVAISDFGETDDGHVFLVMELLAGHDLRQLLQVEGALAWPRARGILLQVTAALQAAHERGIVHRDIKPSNVFLVDGAGSPDEDFIKVLDFGIAKLTGHGGDSSAELTSPQQIVGTVGYIAPEMAMGVKDDLRSDVYAVGVMMFRMLTGTMPFGEGNALGILAQHIHAPIPSAREVQPSVPKLVDALIVRAMAKKPEERFENMAEFRGALQAAGVDGDGVGATHGATVAATEVLESLGIGEGDDSGAAGTDVVEISGDGATDVSEAPSEDAPRRRWLVPLIGAGALAVGLAVGLGSQSDDPPRPATAPPAVAGGGEVETPPPTDPSSEGATEPVIPLGSTGASDAPSVSDAPTSMGVIPEPAGGPDESTGQPSGTTTLGPHPEPESEPANKPARKPRSDQRVVGSLAAKIERRCSAELVGKVRVEGMISAAGRVQSVLVTPQGGLGGCERFVKAAKFDPTRGARPMPRFSVGP